MFARNVNKVIMSQSVYHQMKNCMIVSGNRHETGGILIGYKRWGCYYIVAITTSDYREKSSKVSFVLDGDRHTQKALTVISQFRYKPHILGVWHSHICDIGVFSEQDRFSNQIMAQLLNGALSMIITMHNQKMTFTAYYISKSGKEKSCRVLVGFDRHLVLNFLRKGYRGMDSNERCSHCIYWQNRKCTITGEAKNDGICTCGQFRSR